MLSRVAPLLAIAAVGCAPQNATLIDGDFLALLADGTSLSLLKDAVDPEDKGWDSSYVMDCRDLEEENEAFRLPGINLDCSNAPLHEQWMYNSAFRAVGQKLDPWRGEAIITSEGDFQIGFHHRLPGGEDFRFAIVVDPTFQPTTCDETESGEVVAADVDGNWLEQWSTDLADVADYLATADEAGQAAFSNMEPYLDTGTLFYLNANAYQFNPQDTFDYWYFPEQYQAGFAAGKFAEERFNSRSGRYALPTFYTDPDSLAVGAPPAADLFYCDMEAGADPLTAGCITNDAGAAQSFSELIDRTVTVADETQSELARMQAEDGSLYLSYRPMVHDNAWRVPDGLPAGLDSWTEMHYNWVVFSGDTKLEAGGSAKGAFSLVLDAEDSESRFFVSGEFEVEKIKVDKWIEEDLREEKKEENGVKLWCFDS